MSRRARSFRRFRRLPHTAIRLGVNSFAIIGTGRHERSGQPAARAALGWQIPRPLRLLTWRGLGTRRERSM